MVPVVLLTGFLGSGKTTLLNSLMAKRGQDGGEDQKWAVIVNEFGQVGIDGDLVPDGFTEQVELPGGCICCALDEDLEKTILKVMESQGELAMILIETTGIAEPLPISWTLAKEHLADQVRLAAVVTVVDSSLFLSHRATSPGVDNQVEHADVLVLSKTDLLTSGIPAELTRALAELNPDAVRLRTDDPSITDKIWTIVAEPKTTHPLTLLPEEGNSRPHHRDEFKSVSAPIDDVLDWDELEESLEALPADFIRVKGIAKIFDETSGEKQPQLMAFHRVGARVSKEVISGDFPPRVVAIGIKIAINPLLDCIRNARRK